jgi:hypothetical protein
VREDALARAVEQQDLPPRQPLDVPSGNVGDAQSWVSSHVDERRLGNERASVEGDDLAASGEGGDARE